MLMPRQSLSRRIAPLLCRSRSSSSTSNTEFRRFAVEMGTGTSLRREDHTAASIRAVQDALWKVSLTVYRALDKNPDEMKVNVIIGVPKPEKVDQQAVLNLVYHMVIFQSTFKLVVWQFPVVVE